MYAIENLCWQTIRPFECVFFRNCHQHLRTILKCIDWITHDLQWKCRDMRRLFNETRSDLSLADKIVRETVTLVSNERFGIFVIIVVQFSYGNKRAVGLCVKFSQNTLFMVFSSLTKQGQITVMVAAAVLHNQNALELTKYRQETTWNLSLSKNRWK